MNAREQIRAIPLETLVEMVRLLTNDRADPQFVRAIAMDLKGRDYEKMPGASTKPATLPGK